MQAAMFAMHQLFIVYITHTTDMIPDIKTGTWSHANGTANVCKECTRDYKIVEVRTCKLHNSTKAQLFKCIYNNEILREE